MSFISEEEGLYETDGRLEGVREKEKERRDENT
jgi:hypothetical protein